MALNFEWTVDNSVVTSENISAEDVEALNQVLEQSIWVDMNRGLEILWYVSLWINIVYLIIFIATAIGLYKLSKKLWDQHSWLAFVPIIQIYTLIKTAWYSFIKWFLLLILFWVIAILLGWVLITWLGTIILSFLESGSLYSIAIAWIITSFVMLIFIIIASTFFLYAGIARRTWQGWGTALLMTLFPWCMLWIVANRIPDLGWKDLSQVTSSDSIPQESSSKIEL